MSSNSNSVCVQTYVCAWGGLYTLWASWLVFVQIRWITLLRLSKRASVRDFLSLHYYNWSGICYYCTGKSCHLLLLLLHCNCCCVYNCFNTSTDSPAWAARICSDGYSTTMSRFTLFYVALFRILQKRTCLCFLIGCLIETLLLCRYFIFKTQCEWWNPALVGPVLAASCQL